MKAGWYIMDGKTRVYIPRAWDTEKEALTERAILLRGYPKTSEWHTRLHVQYRQPKEPKYTTREEV